MIQRIEMVEVAARDGLQNEPGFFPTADKLELIERAIAAGSKRIEVASFVHPVRVPQMADAEAVCAGLPKRDAKDVTYIGLVLNKRGALRALETVFGHNLLDIPESAEGFKAGFWWDLFHSGFFVPYQYASNHVVILVYPFVAWTGVMMLGYCTGILYSAKYTAEQRKKILIRLGIGLTVFFVVLRYSNVYGDPVDWSSQKNGLYTFLSFMKVNKYPPSLLYLSILIGPSLILLAYLENIKNRFTNLMIVYGRTACFYYLRHIYQLDLIAAICFVERGQGVQEGVSTGQFPCVCVGAGEGGMVGRG
jgi:hypothetical protein